MDENIVLPVVIAFIAGLLVGWTLRGGNKARLADHHRPPKPMTSRPTRAEHRVQVDAEVLALVRAGNRIGAIKLLRDKTGLGLKESKDVVDALG